MRRQGQSGKLKDAMSQKLTKLGWRIKVFFLCGWSHPTLKIAATTRHTRRQILELVGSSFGQFWVASSHEWMCSNHIVNATNAARHMRFVLARRRQLLIMVCLTLDPTLGPNPNPIPKPNSNLSQESSVPDACGRSVRVVAKKEMHLASGCR